MLVLRCIILRFVLIVGLIGEIQLGVLPFMKELLENSETLLMLKAKKLIKIIVC